MLSLKDLSRGRSMEKEFALVPQGFLKVLLYLSIGHGNERRLLSMLRQCLMKLSNHAASLLL